MVESNGELEKVSFFCDTLPGEFQCVKWCPTKAVVKVE
jgi:hypothetical protein